MRPKLLKFLDDVIRDFSLRLQLIGSSDSAKNIYEERSKVSVSN